MTAMTFCSDYDSDINDNTSNDNADNDNGDTNHNTVVDSDYS